MEKSNMLFSRNSSGMVRELSWVDVLIMSISAPAASGILYYSVNTQSSYPGGSVVMAFLLGLIIFLPISFVISSLSTAIPRNGSLYVAVSRVLGGPLGYIGAYLYFIGQALIAGVLGNIIMGIMGGICIAISNAYVIESFKDIGLLFQSTNGKVIGGFVFILFFWFISLKGIKVFKRSMKILFYLPLIATILTIIILLFHSPASARESFNLTWGNDSFDSIINTARANGWTTPSFSWSTTFALLLVVLWAYNGIDMGSYSGSETRNPNKSFMKGVMLGWLCVGILYVLLAFAVVKPFGEFISAYDYLFKNFHDKLGQIMPAIEPSIPFYLISVTGNKLLGIIISLLIVLWFVNSIPPIFLSTSRIIFALALDRSIPEKLSGINEKKGAPTWATHITALIALLGVLFQTLNVTIVLGSLLFCTFFIFWMYGLSAMLLPFEKPLLYDLIPVKINIAKIPLLSIAGFLTFTIGWFFIFLSLREISINIAFSLSLILLLGMIVFFIQLRKNSSLNITSKKIMDELPPE